MRTKREWIEARDENGTVGRIAKVETQLRSDTLDGDNWMTDRTDYFTESGKPLRLNVDDGSFADVRSDKRYWPI